MGTSTRTCHTLKDLEKMLPSVASINGMQVKEYVQELVDEGKIRMEKIGSGNWYWCFAGEEKKERERRLEQLRKEVDHAQASYDKAQASLASRKQQWEREDADDQEWQKAVQEKEALEQECQQLRTEWAAAVSTMEGGKGIQEIKEETQAFREQAQMWTDNIYVLEQYLCKLAGGDREIITAIQQECYGEEYVEGEGLRELE
ncbi:hypothetical protein EYZ11_006424 [Aspergillus tanneri]|uniref:Meiotic nuclear division protein 1 n=1 Tax=Aspergillus tanneri TaxID=1220188 RepID=A0A4S3JG30_9EURO|nr:hypothetical protein EYZ11_006424 [Aspergillus tanneri]